MKVMAETLGVTARMRSMQSLEPEGSNNSRGETDANQASQAGFRCEISPYSLECERELWDERGIGLGTRVHVKMRVLSFTWVRGPQNLGDDYSDWGILLFGLGCLTRIDTSTCQQQPSPGTFCISKCLFNLLL